MTYPSDPLLETHSPSLREERAAQANTAPLRADERPTSDRTLEATLSKADVYLRNSVVDSDGNRISAAFSKTPEGIVPVDAYVTCKDGNVLAISPDQAFSMYEGLSAIIYKSTLPDNPHPTQRANNGGVETLTAYSELVSPNAAMVDELKQLGKALLPPVATTEVKSPTGTQFDIPTKGACAASTKSADAPSR